MSELIIYVVAGLTVLISSFLSPFLFYSISIPVLLILVLLLFSKVNNLTNEVNPYLLSGIGAIFGLSAIFIDILSHSLGTIAIFFILSSIIKVMFKKEADSLPETSLAGQNRNLPGQSLTERKYSPDLHSQEELLMIVAKKIDNSLADIQTRLQRIENDGHNKSYGIDDAVIERIRMSITKDMVDFWKMNQKQMDQNFDRLTTVLENEIKMVESSMEMLITNMVENNKTQQDIQTSLEQIKEKSNELATIDVIRELLMENMKEMDHSIDMRHIQNHEIKHYFYRALDEAKHEVCIISPWISDWVVKDSEMETRFEKLLTNGVNIKILFGINGNSSSFKNDQRGERTAQVVQDLKRKYTKKRHTGKLQFGKVNSHYKLFICDDDFFVESSMNILSNKGDYGNGFKWHEGGTYSEHQKTLITLKNIYFGPNNTYNIV
ncbi:hypothetical protein V7659_29485 [Neobacillus drentensis]|uniref:hypothetical protein n=1 Tax=Neobacillus drentensis TaxID=220684 RepID=UPI002FFDBBC8